MQTATRFEHTDLQQAAPPAAGSGFGRRLSGFVGRFTGVIAAVVIGGVCLLEIVLGSMPTRIYSVDLFIFLDGAWRVDSGQVPHQDFFAGFSVLLWKPLQLAFNVSGFDLEGLGLARALFTAVIGAWTFLLVRRRLTPILVLLVTFVAVALVSAARPLGVSASMFSHAMFYNRVGYALLFIVVLECLYLARFWAPAADRLWFGFSTGMAIACLALLKVSFLVPAVLLLGVGVALWGTTRRHLLGIAAGGLVVLGLAIALLGFTPAPWISEMADLAQARDDSMFGTLRDIVRAELLPLTLMSAGVGAGIAVAASLDRAVAIRYVIATLAVAAADVYCRATNAQAGDLPLSALWCVLGVLLIAAAATERRSAFRPPRYAASVVSLVCLLVLTLPLVGKDVVSLAGAAYVSATDPAAPRIESDRLASWTTEAWRGDAMFLNSNGPRLVAITNDGLRLVKHNTRANESVGSVTSVNRFSSALGRPPAPGGAPWIHLDNNFSSTNPPDAKRLFGTPDVLMVQRYESVDGSKPLLEVYPDLLQDYERVTTSRYWMLYRRRA
jgi:hypothetical protein